MSETRAFSRSSIFFVSLAMFSTSASGEPPKRPDAETTYSATITSLPGQPGASRVEFCLAKAARGTTIEISMITERLVTEEIVEQGPTLAATGITQPSKRVQTRPITETYTQKFPASAVACRRIDGKEVSTKTMLQELASERPAIFLPEGKMLDPRFAKMFQPTTLVLSFLASKTIVPVPADAPVTYSSVPANAPPQRPSTQGSGRRPLGPTFQSRSATGEVPHR